MIQHEKLAPKFKNRILVNDSAEKFLERARSKMAGAFFKAGWKLECGENLFYCETGLGFLLQALQNYQGGATELAFDLRVSEEAKRDFYPWAAQSPQGRVRLPVLAKRLASENDEGAFCETLTLVLPESQQAMATPASLCEPFVLSIPHGLLMPVNHDFEWVFANQVALLAHLRSRVARARSTLWEWLRFWKKDNWRERASLAYRKIHPRARVHPTAVVEASEIGEGCEIGPHAVVRFSVLGKNVQLRAGAKVEFCSVHDGSWLMHDLVLYRSHAEREVFLIHGPYQFSYFQNRSAAFATILMDYRADANPFSVKNSDQSFAGNYRGHFFGSLYEEDSKTLGGVLLAPGRIVPRGVWLAPSADDVHQIKNPERLKRFFPNAPKEGLHLQRGASAPDLGKDPG
jgi:hypothetical protein